MARKYFGTDGIRGLVGEFPITPDFVMTLGFAAGTVLARDLAVRSGAGVDRPRVLIGKDTRISGYMLESALEAGLSAAGVDVLLTGPMPTPAVAYLTRALRLQAGVMISASHNPYPDNGIKFFSATGEKLPDTIEESIEEAVDKGMKTRPSAELGRVRRIEDAAGRYIEFCKSTFPNDQDLKGLRIVVDCAHGATYHIAPHVFHELGAEVIPMGHQPNGFNINDQVGATSPAALCARVVDQRADLGIALDGDGDRLVMVDARGRAYDGDQLLYAIVKSRAENRRMTGGVVGTLMTNLALELALKARGIPFARAKVGDRYVLEQLVERDWVLGGENSGHIICRDRHTTGDGIVSALQVLTALVTAQSTLADYLDELTLFPQVLINVPIAKNTKPLDSEAVKQRVAEAERALEGRGRVLLRASGTEPVIRVMVEGSEEAKVREWAKDIAHTVSQVSNV